MRRLLRLLAIFGTGVVMMVGLGYWTSSPAQTPLTETEAIQFCSDLDNPTAIALPFNPTTDGLTELGPRQISHRPCDEVQAVVGDDTRLPVLNRFFPWSAVGRLEWQFADESAPFSHCTGTLIGRDLVLTNSHCLQHPKTKQITSSQAYESQEDKIVFRPSLIRGLATSESVVLSYEYGWQTEVGNVSEDWALLKLKEPLGDQQGYLGWRVLDFTNANITRSLANQTILAGYSADYPTDSQRAFGQRMETAGVHAQCTIEGSSEGLGYETRREFEVILPDGTVLGYAAKFSSETPTPGLLVHDCDTTGGSSGSAILALFEDGYSVVGIHAGWNPVIPDSIPAGSSREECTTVVARDQEGNPTYRNVGICRNRGVQASRWAAQARTMRGDS